MKQMTTPASIAQNLYEIQDCSICLLQLSKDLAALPCGHCFHYACIMQVFQTRQTCPFCQKYYDREQVLALHYQPMLKSKANQKINCILQKLKLPQRNQIEFILNHFKNQSEQLTMVRRLKGQLESEVEIQKKYIQNVKFVNEEQKQQISRLQKENMGLLKQQKEYCQILKYQFVQQEYLNRKIQILESKLADYEILKKYEKIIDNNEQLRKLKSQMENQNIPPRVMAMEFYALCQIAYFEVNKNKRALRDYEQKFQFYKEQLASLKQQNHKLEEHIKRLLEQIQLGKKQEQQEHKQTEAQKRNTKGSQKAMNNKSKKTKAPRKKDDTIYQQGCSWSEK